jgi:hypothetical protein
MSKRLACPHRDRPQTNEIGQNSQNCVTSANAKGLADHRASGNLDRHFDASRDTELGANVQTRFGSGAIGDGYGQRQAMFAKPEWKVDTDLMV